MKCIKYLEQNKIVRVSDEEADDLVLRKKGFYVPKQLYKDHLKAEKEKVTGMDKEKKRLKEIQKELKQQRKSKKKIK